MLFRSSSAHRTFIKSTNWLDRKLANILSHAYQQFVVFFLTSVAGSVEIRFMRSQRVKKIVLRFRSHKHLYFIACHVRYSYLRDSASEKRNEMLF